MQGTSRSDTPAPAPFGVPSMCTMLARCNRMKKLTCLLIAAALFAACSKDATVPNYDTQGTVVARFPGSSVSLGSLHVKTTPNEQCGVVWTVLNDAKLHKRTATGVVTSATFDDFTVGSTVTIVSNG